MQFALIDVLRRRARPLNVRKELKGLLFGTVSAHFKNTTLVSFKNRGHGQISRINWLLFPFNYW
jgi:hypothetical protein